MYTATITLCIDKLSVVRQKFYEKFLINYDSMNRREICKLPGDCFFLLNKVRRKSFRRRQVKLEVVSTALVVNIHEKKFVFYRMKTHIFELKKLRCDDKSLCFTAYNFSSSYLNDTTERESETWRIWSHLRWYRGCRLITWHLVTNSCTWQTA